MHRAWFFKVTALSEGATGLFLLAQPSVVVALLLGEADSGPALLVVGRVLGAALLTIGIAAWQGRGDPEGSAQQGLLGAVLIYDVAAAALLAHAGMVLNLSGLALWPAAAGHTVLAVWAGCCLAAGTERRLPR